MSDTRFSSARLPQTLGVLALLAFSLWFPWQIMATLHLGAYLGPGLGDALSYQPVQELWARADAVSAQAG